MRDPKRIKEFCNQLAEVWETNCPDWRFFQLVNNVCRRNGSDNFYVEEDETIETIRKFFTS